VDSSFAHGVAGFFFDDKVVSTDAVPCFPLPGPPRPSFFELCPGFSLRKAGLFSHLGRS